MKLRIIDFSKKVSRTKIILNLSSAIRALDYFMFMSTKKKQHNRDLKMFEKCSSIIENKSKKRRFFWAHNEHINNKGFGNYSNRNIYNLGRHLKEYYIKMIILA
jgi:erythromycin esterase